ACAGSDCPVRIRPWRAPAPGPPCVRIAPVARARPGRRLRQPLVAMTSNELVVRPMRIARADAVDLGQLTGRKLLPAVQRPPSLEKPLPPQDLMNPGDAASESVPGIEQRAVRVGELGVEGHQPGGDRVSRIAYSPDLLQHRHRGMRPNRPLTQQAADDA